MCVRLLFIFGLIIQCCSVEITLKKFDKDANAYTQSDEITVNNFDNMKKFLDFGIHNYVNIKYSYGSENRIDVIRDFTELEYVWMTNTNLETSPVFKNVPKLIAVDLSKNEIPKITKEMFGNTNLSSIFLAHNEISEIEDNSFGENIFWVQMSCNKLTHFSSKWFKNPTKLYALNLDANNIEYIKGNAFEGFSSLGDFFLSYNKIKKLEPGTLAFTNWFAWVHLHNNGLTELNADVFQAPVTLHGLNIQYNNLTYLSEDFMVNVRIKQFINVVGNPWQCTCFERIRRWVNWEDYGKHFFKKKNNADPYCVKSVQSPQYCDPNVPDKEGLISTFAETVDVETKEQYCSKLWKSSFQPCAAKNICFAYLP